MEQTMSSRSNDPFFNVPREQRPTSEGMVDFPICYYETRCVQAFFRCPLPAVTASLHGTGLRPGQVLGREAIVAMAFFEYTDTSIGPYNEVGIAVPALPLPSRSGSRWLELLRDVDNPCRELGFNVLHLPVSTVAACAAGREIWGYPKFVSDIPFRLDGRDLDSGVTDPVQTNQSICRIYGRMGPGLPGPTLSLLLYSQVEQQRLRATVNVRGNTRLHLPGSVRLQLGQSHHPMHQTLRQLGLDGAKPLLLSVTRHFQSRLNLGRAY